MKISKTPRRASYPAAGAANSRTQAKCLAPRTTSQSNANMHTTTMHDKRHHGHNQESTASAKRVPNFNRASQICPRGRHRT